jgi:hypothetical protein
VIAVGLAGALAEHDAHERVRERWASVAPILFLLAIAAIFQTLAFVGYWVYVARGLTAQLFRYSTVSAVIRITLVLVGSNWGVLGVAAAFALAPADLAAVAVAHDLDPYRAPLRGRWQDHRRGRRERGSGSRGVLPSGSMGRRRATHPRSRDRTRGAGHCRARRPADPARCRERDRDGAVAAAPQGALVRRGTQQRRWVPRRSSLLSRAVPLSRSRRAGAFPPESRSGPRWLRGSAGRPWPAGRRPLPSASSGPSARRLRRRRNSSGPCRFPTRSP